MSKGLDIKPNFGLQKYTTSNPLIQFQILASTRDEAKALTKMSHDCGNAVFELVIVKKPAKVPKNNTTIRNNGESEMVSVSNASATKTSSKVQKEKSSTKVQDPKTSSKSKKSESIAHAGGEQAVVDSTVSNQTLQEAENKLRRKDQVKSSQKAPTQIQADGQQDKNHLQQKLALSGQTSFKRSTTSSSSQKHEETVFGADPYLHHGQHGYNEVPLRDSSREQAGNHEVPQPEELDYYRQDFNQGQRYPEQVQLPVRSQRPLEHYQKNHYPENYEVDGGARPVISDLISIEGHSETMSELGWNLQASNYSPFDNQNLSVRRSVSDASSSSQPTSRSIVPTNNPQAVAKTCKPFNQATGKDFESFDLLSKRPSNHTDGQVAEVDPKSQSSVPTSVRLKPSPYSKISNDVMDSRQSKLPMIEPINMRLEPINLISINQAVPPMTAKRPDSGLQAPASGDSVSMDSRAKPGKTREEKKDKNKKAKHAKREKEIMPKDYSTLLQICYWPIHDLSEAWLKRIYKLAKKLKKMPHSMFNQTSRDPEASEREAFADIRELHPLGKFLKRSPPQPNLFIDCSDDETQSPKFDQSEFISLDNGQRDFGGLFVPRQYNVWRGVSEKAEGALTGAVSRGRLAMADPDSSLDTKTSILLQAQEDVIQIGKKFREAHLQTQQRLLATNGFADTSRQIYRNIDVRGLLEEMSPCEDLFVDCGEAVQIHDKGYLKNSRSANTEAASQQ